MVGTCLATLWEKCIGKAGIWPTGSPPVGARGGDGGASRAQPVRPWLSPALGQRRGQLPFLEGSECLIPRPLRTTAPARQDAGEHQHGQHSCQELPVELSLLSPRQGAGSLPGTRIRLREPVLLVHRGCCTCHQP